MYNEARKYAAPYNIAVVCAYGGLDFEVIVRLYQYEKNHFTGGSKYEQQKALEQGAELVIATPVSFEWIAFSFYK